MGDRLPIIDDSDATGNYNATQPTTGRPPSSSFRYEELMAGSVPCPSCHGAGRVPKEMESQLVAIIPMSDRRLKPRRTCIWVSVAITLCLIVSGLLLFFLIPRSFSLSMKEWRLNSEYAYYHNHSRIEISLMAPLNITNNNFYQIEVTSYSVKVLSDIVLTKDSSIILGQGSMTGEGIMIPMQKKENIIANVSVAIHRTKANDEDVFYSQCYMDAFFYAQFEYTVTVGYLGHSEQSTLTTKTKVCCGEHANETYCGDRHSILDNPDDTSVMLI